MYEVLDIFYHTFIVHVCSDYMIVIKWYLSKHRTYDILYNVCHKMRFMVINRLFQMSEKRSYSLGRL